MKRTLAVFLLTLGLLFSVANAQEKPATTSLNPEEVKQIQESAQGLRQVFGIEQSRPAIPPTPQQLQQSEKKTLADVADKTVDMVQRLVTNVAVTLQKIAPDVWRILIKQQYAKAIGDLLPPWALLIVTILYHAILKKSWKITEKTSNDERGTRIAFISVVPMVAGVVFSTWGVAALARSIKLLINPQFYAIRDLLTMLLNRGQTM